MAATTGTLNLSLGSIFGDLTPAATFKLGVNVPLSQFWCRSEIK